MPYEIRFEKLPAGVCVEAVRDGGTAKVRAIEFVSEEDGDTLIERLEGFGSEILAKLPAKPPIQPSQIQHLLAIIRRDGTASVYVNEIQTVAMVQAKRELKASDEVFADLLAGRIDLLHRRCFLVFHYGYYGNLVGPKRRKISR